MPEQRSEILSIEQLAGASAEFPPQGFRQVESKLAGFEVFVPAKKNENLPEAINFKCPQCGATTAFSVDSGTLACPHCGYSEEVAGRTIGRDAENFEFRVDTLERSSQGWGADRKDMACQQCGGVISAPADALTFTCPFCGSNKVLYREPLEDVLRPRHLIPFKVEPQSCLQITREWLGSSWMTPRELRDSSIDHFTPVYIPYWTFSAGCHAAWQAEVAHERTETTYVDGKQETRQVTEWRTESGKVQKAIDNLLVPGTTRLNLRTLGQVDGFNIAGLVLYEPRYLAGMQAQAYDVPLDEAWDAGRAIMREQMRRACLDRASSTQVRDFTVSIDFRDEAWRYVLVPVYTNIYQFDGQTYQFIINGQSGRIAGPRPVDWRKVWLAIAALLTPGLLIILLGLLSSTGEASGFGLVLMAIGMVIAFFLFSSARRVERV